MLRRPLDNLTSCCELKPERGEDLHSFRVHSLDLSNASLDDCLPFGILAIYVAARNVGALIFEIHGVVLPISGSVLELMVLSHYQVPHYQDILLVESFRCAKALPLRLLAIKLFLEEDGVIIGVVEYLIPVVVPHESIHQLLLFYLLLREPLVAVLFVYFQPVGSA